jgi:hypothetical protein
MRSLAALLTLSALAGMAASGASAAPPTSSTLLISHVKHGCHHWSLNGGPYTVNQTAHLVRGGSLVLTNNDLMVQDLVKTSGPAVKMQLIRQSHMGTMHMTMPMNGKASPYAMAHMGAQLKVTFPTAGTYHFKLVDRGDYFDGIKTIGPDNKPQLVVTVA